MAIHLLFFSGQEAPPTELLDGAIVVVWEVAYRVVVEIPARQVAVVENNKTSVAVNESPAVPFAVVATVNPHIVEVTEVAKPIALILPPEIPKAVVIENTSAAETR